MTAESGSPNVLQAPRTCQSLSSRGRYSNSPCLGMPSSERSDSSGRPEGSKRSGKYSTSPLSETGDSLPRLLRRWMRGRLDEVSELERLRRFRGRSRGTSSPLSASTPGRSPAAWRCLLRVWEDFGESGMNLTLGTGEGSEPMLPDDKLSFIPSRRN